MKQQERVRGPFRWWMTPIVAVLCLAAYVLIRVKSEHPIYATFARDLPEARRNARPIVGELTLRGHYAANGIDTSRDTQEWMEFRSRYYRAVFEDKPWSAYGLNRNDAREVVKNQMPSAIAASSDLKTLELRFRQEDFKEIDQGEFNWHTMFRSNYSETVSFLHDLINLSCNLLVAGARAGDELALESAFDLLHRIMEMSADYPTIESHKLNKAARSNAAEAVELASIILRNDPDLIRLMEQRLSGLPDQVQAMDAIIGSARISREFLDSISGLPPSEMDRMLQIWTGYEMLVELDPMIEYYNDSLAEKLDGEQIDRYWRPGKYTRSGLEAALWKSVVDCHDWLERAESEDRQALRQEIEDLAEWSSPPIVFCSGQTFVAMDEIFDIRRRSRLDRPKPIAAQIARRFPTIDELPEVLPDEIELNLPPVGRPISYRKTDYGFTLYFHGHDGVDEGFVDGSEASNDNAWISYESVGADNDDYGYVITYLDELQPDSAGG